jgi:hypothetical protein
MGKSTGGGNTTSARVIFNCLERLDVFGDIRWQAVFPATRKDKVFVPTVGFEAVIDVLGGGEIK